MKHLCKELKTLWSLGFSHRVQDQSVHRDLAWWSPSEQLQDTHTHTTHRLQGQLAPLHFSNNPLNTDQTKITACEIHSHFEHTPWQNKCVKMLPQGHKLSILNYLGTYLNSFQENATVCFFANYFNTTSTLAFDCKNNDLIECTKRIVEEVCCYCWFIINHKSSEKKIKRTSETEKSHLI